jgi:NAD(P)-dependent dehydrogenase (short-subunit alcohol dehydrogenase family)
MSSPSKALVWLITGCSSGFGASLSIIALKAGHKVIATSRNPSKSPELVKQVEGLGGIWLELDMNEETAHFQKLVELATKRFGPIDVLVNNAGISLIGAVEDTRSDYTLCELFNTNSSHKQCPRSPVPYGH